MVVWDPVEMRDGETVAVLQRGEDSGRNNRSMIQFHVCVEDILSEREGRRGEESSR